MMKVKYERIKTIIRVTLYIAIVLLCMIVFQGSNKPMGEGQCNGHSPADCGPMGMACGPPCYPC